jgi:hypothetical protein
MKFFDKVFVVMPYKTDGHNSFYRASPENLVVCHTFDDACKERELMYGCGFLHVDIYERAVL